MKCFSVPLLFVCLKVIAVCCISDLDQQLITAADQGDIVRIKALIENGANVNAVDQWKQTPLHWAAFNGRTEAIKTLIEYRANINATSKGKETPLHKAAYQGSVDTIKTLIENGANVNAENSEMETPLQQAASRGHTDAIRILFENGANVNAVDKSNKTALHWAALGGHVEAAKALIAYGANVIGAEDQNKRTPLHWAALGGHKDVFELVERGSRNTTSASRLACMKYSKPQATSIIDLRILDDEQANRGEFPWMAGLFYPNPESLLLTYGCGGTIISEHYILTAAHCVLNSRKPNIVRVGKLTINDDDGLQGKIYQIKKITRHPKYRKMKGTNDIALIETTQKIVFTDDIAPACLHTETKDVDSELVVIGWGVTDPENTSEFSNELLKATLTTKPLLECNSTILEWNKVPNLPQYRNGISEGQYCAYYDPKEEKDACQGDSGGPLQYFHNNSSSTATVIGIWFKLWHHITEYLYSCGLLHRLD